MQHTIKNSISIGCLNIIFITLFLLINFNSLAQVTVYNDGIDVYVETGLTVTIIGSFVNQTNGSDGTVDNKGVIEVSENWTNNAGNTVFSTNDGEVEMNGTNLQTIGGNPTTFFDLTCNKASNKVAINTTTTITNILDLTSGNIELNTNTLIIDNNGGCSNASTSSYVEADNSGFMQKNFNSVGAFTYPIGDVNNFSSFRVTINNVSAFSGDESISLRVTNAIHPNINNGEDHIARYWTINSSGLPDIDYDVSYSYVNADINGTETNLIAALWNGGSWLQCDPVNAGTNTLSSSSGLTTIPSNNNFSAGSGAALPIELLNMTVEAKNSSAVVKWTTATEINNDYFTLERSKDGIIYEEIAVVEGIGASYQVHTYEYTDDAPLYGTSYYRLKQTDINGKFEYFNPVSFHRKNVTISSMRVYPNPLTRGQHLTLEMNETDTNEEVLVLLFNHIGQEVYSKVIISESNGILTGIDVSNRLAPGVYLITASSKDEICQQKLVISSISSINIYAQK